MYWSNVFIYVRVVFVNVYCIFIISYSTNLLRFWSNSIKWRLYFIGYQYACYNREIQNNGDIDKIEIYFSVIQKENKWSRVGMGLDSDQRSRLLKSTCFDILSHIFHLELKMTDYSIYHQHTRIPASIRGKREWRGCVLSL